MSSSGGLNVYVCAFFWGGGARVEDCLCRFTAEHSGSFIARFKDKDEVLLLEGFSTFSDSDPL